MKKFTIKQKQAKACWTTVRGAAPVRSAPKQHRQPKPRKRLRPRSEAAKRRMDLYRPMRNAFLAEHTTCECAWHDTGHCTNRSDDVHHTHGRTGNLLYYFPWWKAVCRKCHERIRVTTDAARAAGLLPPRGEWNEQPDGVLFQETRLPWLAPVNLTHYTGAPIRWTSIVLPVWKLSPCVADPPPEVAAFCEMVQRNEERKSAE